MFGSSTNREYFLFIEREFSSLFISPVGKDNYVLLRRQNTVALDFLLWFDQFWRTKNIERSHTEGKNPTFLRFKNFVVVGSRKVLRDTTKWGTLVYYQSHCSQFQFTVGNEWRLGSLKWEEVYTEKGCGESTFNPVKNRSLISLFIVVIRTIKEFDCTNF